MDGGGEWDTGMHPSCRLLHNQQQLELGQYFILVTVEIASQLNSIIIIMSRSHAAIGATLHY
jgi:hypothetical protein